MVGLAHIILSLQNSKNNYVSSVSHNNARGPKHCTRSNILPPPQL